MACLLSGILFDYKKEWTLLIHITVYLVPSKRSYLPKCGRNLCTNKKLNMNVYMFIYALFIIIQTGNNPFICDSEKTILQRQNMNQRLPETGSRGGADYNETLGDFFQVVE